MCNLRNSPRQSAIVEAFNEANCLFPCVCLGNTFAEVIPFTQNMFISVKIIWCCLFNIFTITLQKYKISLVRLYLLTSSKNAKTPSNQEKDVFYLTHFCCFSFYLHTRQIFFTNFLACYQNPFNITHVYNEY